MRLRMKLRSIILVLIIYGGTFGLFWASGVRAVTIYPAMHSYGWQSVPNANNGGSNNFEITSYDRPPGNMRGWIAFDLSPIPKDVWVLSGELSLRVWYKTIKDPSSNTGESVGRVYGVYRLTQSWRQFNVTYGNQPNFALQDNSTSTVPRGDAGWLGPVLRMKWDVTRIVKEWLSDKPNYGLVVKDIHENLPVLYSTQFFTNSAVPNQTYYPTLTIIYLIPTATAIIGGLFLVETLVLLAIMKRKFSITKRSN